MKSIYLTSALAGMLLLTGCSQSSSSDRLYTDFVNPPSSSRPRVWWHWMNGNISKDGIRKDLEWMDRAGIVGFHNFDAGMATPQIVNKRLVYMTPEWKDAFNYALDIADSLGMEVTVASSPGWSITGGPWVSEEDAEKKLVWSETVVEGGRTISTSLPQPPSCSGPYQDELQYPKDPDMYRFYKDLYVVAMRRPALDTARINQHRVKSGFEVNYLVADKYPTPETTDCTAIGDVVDLTDAYKDGVLTWDVPEGQWKIFRFGYSLLGRQNGPASPEATGLEVDKLDRDAVRRYYQNYLGMYADASNGRLGADGVIKYLMIDSYESGRGTWTARMEDEFVARRGYALRPWLPVLAGQIIGSADMSERFLFDWRQTLGELMAENHYDVVNEILAPYGMKRHTESHEERTAFVGDGMMVKRHADIPMSAFWVRFRAGWHATYPTAEADLKESSSVSHIYGQNICAAESFTTNGFIGKWDGFGAYQCYPGNLKPVADAAMSFGLNRFVIHCSVHQPVDDKIPGINLGRYGQWFNRHDTWAEEARPWTDYLSRSSFMLQQGRYVADVAYFYGEDKNITGRFFDERARIPDGYSFDFVNADILLNVMDVDSGCMTTPSGMRYRMLYIDPEVKYMSLPVLERIAEFVNAGVALCGPRPQKCANLMASDERFAELVSEIWDAGRANVCESRGIAAALAEAKIDRDVEFIGAEITEADLLDSLKYVHRRLDDGEIYWISNCSTKARKMTVSLRTEGYEPQFWNAEDGSRKEVSYRMSGGRTEVILDMDADDAGFIVMMDKTKVKEKTIPARSESWVTGIDGPWTVSFQTGRGAPEGVVLDSLCSLTESEVEGIKYFSGTAVYSKAFDIELADGQYVLDLGRVGNMAHVYLNGTDMGLSWRAPHRVDVTGVLREGRNELEVRVIDSWANRLIGDEQPGVVNRLTYTAEKYYLATDELVPSGLMGPVSVISIK